jgi:hypothetical protein
MPNSILRDISFKESVLWVVKTTLVSMMRKICQAWILLVDRLIDANNIKNVLEQYEIKRILT